MIRSQSTGWNDVSEFKTFAGDFLCPGNKITFIGTSCKMVNTGKGNLMLTKY